MNNAPIIALNEKLVFGSKIKPIKVTIPSINKNIAMQMNNALDNSNGLIPPMIPTNKPRTINSEPSTIFTHVNLANNVFRNIFLHIFSIFK